MTINCCVSKYFKFSESKELKKTENGPLFSFAADRRKMAQEERPMTLALLHATI
jgi:hypothetical protein